MSAVYVRLEPPISSIQPGNEFWKRPDREHSVLESIDYILINIRTLAGHVFWPDELSIADESHFSEQRLTSHARVTDSYLLALAQLNGGRLATMERKLAAEVAGNDKSSLEVLCNGDSASDDSNAPARRRGRRRA